jgi:hypothetical protein
VTDVQAFAERFAADLDRQANEIREAMRRIANVATPAAIAADASYVAALRDVAVAARKAATP